MYVHVSVGTECAPAVTSNSTPVDYDHDPNSDQQQVVMDDWLSESDSFEDEKWKRAKFLLHVTEEHHLTHDGIVDLLFSVVKERISAHPSDTVEVDKETLLKICEPDDIFSGLNIIKYGST